MRTGRGIVLVIASIVGSLAISTGPTMGADGGTAEDAAREIAAARDDANAAAAAYWEAQGKLDEVSAHKTELDVQTAALEKEVAAVKKIVETVVVNRYIGSGTTGIDLLTGT